jgi:tetratricopeptide (TPR) repeat protein
MPPTYGTLSKSKPYFSYTLPQEIFVYADYEFFAIQAEEVVRQRLQHHPTPKLWCILGDLTRDPTCYEMAWAISSNHYSRAQRSLGFYRMSKGEIAEAIPHFELALSINSLYPNTWFTLACAYMRLEQWDKALNAFSFVVNISPEVLKGPCLPGTENEEPSSSIIHTLPLYS